MRHPAIDWDGKINSIEVFFLECWEIILRFDNTFLVRSQAWRSSIQGIMINDATLHEERTIFVVLNPANGIDKGERQCVASVSAVNYFTKRVIL